MQSHAISLSLGLHIVLILSLCDKEKNGKRNKWMSCPVNSNESLNDSYTIHCFCCCTCETRVKCSWTELMLWNNSFTRQVGFSHQCFTIPVHFPKVNHRCFCKKKKKSLHMQNTDVRCKCFVLCAPCSKDLIVPLSGLTKMCCQQL